MGKKANVIFILILVISWLLPSLSSSAVTVSGSTKTFDPQSGRLVLTTQSHTEITFYISKAATVYIKTKDEDIAVAEADAWKFLADNLFKGTQVTLEKIEGTVTTIWVLEVPS
jgi:hypothetical protein